MGVSLSAGFIGSFFTMGAISTWYAGLVKPALNPPDWIFAPVWTTLYILMGISAFLIWRKYSDSNKKVKRMIKIALGVFTTQLILNASWSIIFFGYQSPFWGLVNIILLLIFIVWTMVLFYSISRPASYILIPYIAWVGFATYLNYAIYVLN